MTSDNILREKDYYVHKKVNYLHNLWNIQETFLTEMSISHGNELLNLLKFFNSFALFITNLWRLMLISFMFEQYLWFKPNIPITEYHIYPCQLLMQHNPVRLVEHTAFLMKAKQNFWNHKLQGHLPNELGQRIFQFFSNCFLHCLQFVKAIVKTFTVFLQKMIFENTIGKFEISPKHWRLQYTTISINHNWKYWYLQSGWYETTEVNVSL